MRERAFDGKQPSLKFCFKKLLPLSMYLHVCTLRTQLYGTVNKDIIALRECQKQI